MGFFWQRRGVQSPSAASTFKSITVSSGLTVSGTLTASGSQIFNSSAATITNTLTASSRTVLTKLVTLSSGLKIPVAAGTTAATFPNYGVTSFGSTAAKSYRLAAPVAGQEKWLYCTAATTGAVQKIIASTSNSINFISTVGSKNIMQFNKNNQIVHLIGASTVKWLVQRVSVATYSTV